MIPIPILKYVLKFFDGIDSVLAKSLERKKPKNEEGITSDLCSLLDNQKPKHFWLSYKKEDLRNDIKKKYPDGLEITYNLETNEYNKSYEGAITQSDLGFIIKYDNYYNHEESWTEFWLFQAKVLKTKNLNPIQYGLRSNFSSTSTTQLDKINLLINILPFNFIKYMLYCPKLKSSTISSSARDKLTLFRDLSITKEIFDGNWSAKLYKNIMDENSELLNGGVFITPTNESPKNLSEIYKNYFKLNNLFSWFIVSRFNLKNTAPNRIYTNAEDIKIDESSMESIAYGIVKGKEKAIKILEKKLGLKNTKYTIYPKYTLEITLRVGG